MRAYELMIIFEPGLGDDQIRSVLTRAEDELKATEAKSVTIDRWGRRRLAYPIENHNEGYYVLLRARANPEPIDEIARQLRVTDGILRHKVMRVPDKAIEKPFSPSGESTDDTSEG